MAKISIGDISLFYIVYDQKKIAEKLDNNKSTVIFLHGSPGMVDHSLY